MIDSHSHGHFSYDSNADYNEMVLSAISKGLNGICFTDHYEYTPDCQQPNVSDYETDKFYGFEMTDYMSKLHSLSEKYSMQNFKVFTGVEFGLLDSNMDEVVYAMDNYKFDSIIGSIHYIPNEPDMYYSNYTEKHDKFTAYSMVLEQYTKLLPKYPKINIMGHFDYVSRYSQVYTDRNMYYKDFSDYFDKLFTIIINMGISLEINTSTYVKRDDLPANKLDLNILKRYKELGGEMITLSSDAHKPDAVAQNFPIMSEFIKNAGFPYLTYFDKEKAVFEKI